MVFGPVWYNLFRKEYNFVSLELPDFTCFLLLQLPCMCLRFPRHIVGIIFSKYGSSEHTPESETSHPKITQIEKSNHLPSSFFFVGFHEKIFPKSVPDNPLHFFSGETSHLFSVSATGGGLGTCGLHLQWPLAWRSDDRRPRR